VTKEFSAAAQQACVRQRLGNVIVSSVFPDPEPTEGVRTKSGELTVGGGFFTPPTTTLEARIISALTSGEDFNFDSGMQEVHKYPDLARERATVSFSRLQDSAP
jgi:hypothetical protein